MLKLMDEGKMEQNFASSEGVSPPIFINWDEKKTLQQKKTWKFILIE